jgi:hypothetical protein
MSTHHVEEKGEPLHCLIKMEIALRADACDVVPSLSRKREISSYFLLIPDLTAESAIPASAKADKRRLHELGAGTDFNRVGSSEIYFYAS